MSKIVIGESEGHALKLDLDVLIPSRLLIQANSGGGKSWLLRRLAEQFFGKVQTIIIDPEGEFYTLREKFGYVLVGEGGETPADVRSAELLAKKFLELKASAICDLYEAFRSRPTDRRQWVRVFLNALIDAPRALWHPVMVIVDEAHKFCPQETPKAASMQEREIISECKGAMISLATTGRKRSFCAIWATQRLAKLDKDASAEMFNRLVGMTIEDVDVDRAADLMSVSKDEKQEFRTSLRTLNPGQFYAFGRAITTERKLVMVGEVQTQHPETGSAARKAEPPPMPEQVKGLLPQLADLPQQAEEKARTEAEYKRTIRDLQQQMRKLQNQAVHAVHPPAPGKVDPRQIERAVVVAVKPLRAQLATFQKAAKQAINNFTRAAAPLNAIANAKLVETTVVVAPSMVTAPAVEGAASQRIRNPQSTSGVAAPAPSIEFSGNHDDLKGPERKILQAMGELLSIGKECPPVEMVAAWSGYSPQGGAFGNPRGALRSKGLIDYPQPGLVTLTEAGRNLIGPQDPPDKEELWRRIQSTCTGPEVKILRALVDNAGPDEMPKEQLAEKAGYSPIGGAFGNPVGALRTKGLIDYPRQGIVKAADWLFVEGVA